MVPSLFDVSVVAVSVVGSSDIAAGSLVAVEVSAAVVVSSSAAIAAVASHPNTRETNTDASFLFTADPFAFEWLMDASEFRTANGLHRSRPRLVARNALQRTCHERVIAQSSA
jgi:hypothetical protein